MNAYAHGQPAATHLWPIALLRQPTLPALTAILDDPGAARVAWDAWQREPPPARAGDWRDVTLHQLRHVQPGLFRTWQQRALDYFKQFDDIPEQLYHFDQLADLLLAQQAYDDLADLLAAGTLPACAQAEHLRAYLLGVLTCERHALTEATATFEHLLAQPDIDPALRPRVWNSLGVAAQYRGRYDEALGCYQHAYAGFVAQGNTLGQAKARFNLGTTHRHLHELTAAAAAFEDSLQLLDRLDARDWQTFALNGLGLVYTELGQWSEAERIYQRVVTLCQSVADTEGAGIALNNLGELFLFTGRWVEAADALDAAEKLVATPLAHIEVHLNQGLRHAARHDMPAAAARFELAYALAAAHHTVRYQVLALYLHGNILAAQHHDAAALLKYEQALVLVEMLRGQIEHSDVRSHLFSTWQSVYMAAVLTCVRLAQPDAALAVAERARARAFFDLLGAGDAPPSLVPARTPLDAAEICQRLQPGTAALVYFCVEPPKTRPVSDEMAPAGNALASILWPSSTIIGFTVTATGVTAQPLALTPEILEQRAFDHDGRTLSGLTPGDNGQLLTPWTLHIVYDALLAPLLAQVATPGHVTPATLCVVPHGPLHRIPIHALHDARGQDLLRQGYDVVVAPSLSAWLQEPSRHHGGRPNCVFGYAPDLQHAQAEAAAVAQVLGVRAQLGAAARQADLLTAARQARVLHCSCHGTFNRHTPLQSALYLADGRVTAADLLAAGSLPLELVFLSACESGRSDVEGADELMGLVRAFLLGGTRTVVVSLWRVDELSTRILAESFYQAYMIEQQSPARALRLAQMAVRTLTWAGLTQRLVADGLASGEIDGTLARLTAMNATWRTTEPACPLAHPYFWAGFTAVGS